MLQKSVKVIKILSSCEIENKKKIITFGSFKYKTNYSQFQTWLMLDEIRWLLK